MLISCRSLLLAISVWYSASAAAHAQDPLVRVVELRLGLAVLHAHCWFQERSLATLQGPLVCMHSPRIAVANNARAA